MEDTNRATRKEAMRSLRDTIIRDVIDEWMRERTRLQQYVKGREGTNSTSIYLIC